MNVEQFKEIFSPWFEDVIQGFQDSFLKDYDINILALLHGNIDREIKFSLSSSKRTHSLKRTKALYNVLTHLYEHIQWKLRKGGSYACGKPGDPQKDFPNATLSSVKLLSQLIRTGLILTQGLSKCEYIDRILMALKLFAGNQGLLFDALLLVNGLKKIHHKPYSVILRCVLTTDYKEVRDPLFYMEIILLFRRLRCLSDPKNKDLCFIATRMKPPSNLISWLASLNMNGSASFLQQLQHKKIAHQLMKKNIPCTLLKKIRDLILGSYYFEKSSYNQKHSKASEFSELFVTDTSPMQLQDNAAEDSDTCIVKKDKTKKKKTKNKKRKKKTKSSKKDDLLDRKSKNLTSLESNRSVSYVNSFSNLVVSNESSTSFHENDDSDIYIIPETKNKISESVSESTEEHRKSNKRRKSKSVQVISPSLKEVPNNNSVNEIITISDSDSPELPLKKSKKSLQNENISALKRMYCEDDTVEKTKKIKFSDADVNDNTALQSDSELCVIADNVKQSIEKKEHNLMHDDKDDTSLVVEISESEATDVSEKLESKEEKCDVNSASFLQNTEKVLALHDETEHIHCKIEVDNHNSFIEKSTVLSQLVSPSKLPSNNVGSVGNFHKSSDVLKVSQESSASICGNNIHLVPNNNSELNRLSNVLEDIHKEGKDADKVITLSKSSTDQSKVREVLNPKSEVPLSCVTDKSISFTEVTSQEDISLCDNDEESKIIYCSPVTNLDIGSKTPPVFEAKSEIADSYSSASKLPKEINFLPQKAKDSYEPCTLQNGGNKSDSLVINSSTMPNKNTEKQDEVQSDVVHSETSEVGSPVNLFCISNDLDNKNKEKTNLGHPPSKELELSFSTVSDTKENSHEKDSAPSLNVCELNAEKNISSPNVSDSNPQKYVTLPVKNILGETLNVVINDKASRLSINESDEISLRTLCKVEQNFPPDSLHHTQTSAQWDDSSEKIEGGESSSDNGPNENHNKTLELNELCVLDEVSLEETQNKSNTDAVHPSESVGESEDSVPKDNANKLSEHQGKEIISNSSHNCRNLLELPSNKISESISNKNIPTMTNLCNDEKIELVCTDAKLCDTSNETATKNSSVKNTSESFEPQNNGKSKSKPENYAETTSADIIGNLTNRTELQNDMKTKSISVLDAKLDNNVVDSSVKNSTLLNDLQSSGNAENILHSNAKECDISGNEDTGKTLEENVAVLIESHNDMAVENNLQINSKTFYLPVDTTKESKSVENIALSTENQTKESIENKSLSNAQSFNIIAKKAPQKNTRLLTESEDVKTITNSQIIEECDTHPDRIIEKKTGPDNGEKSGNNTQRDSPKIIENVLRECVTLIEFKNNLELKPNSEEDLINIVTENASLSILESTSSQNEPTIENVSKTGDVSVNPSQENVLPSVIMQKTLSCAEESEGNLPKLKSVSCPEEIDVETVSDDTQLETTCDSGVGAETCLSVSKFKNSEEYVKETKFLYNEKSHQNFGSNSLKNTLKFMHSEYVPQFCENKDYVSFSDISLRNKGRQIVADSCLKSPIAITNFPSAATAEIFCEYRSGVISSSKADVLPPEDNSSKQPKSPSVSSIASDASKSPCVSSIASDNEIETLDYSSTDEDPQVNDKENVCSQESGSQELAQTQSETVKSSDLLHTNKDCSPSQVHSSSFKDSSPSDNIESSELSYDSSLQANQNLPDVPEEESSEKICPRQSLRLKNKTNSKNEIDFEDDPESGVSVPEKLKSSADVPHNFAVKECSVLCDALPIKPSTSSTNFVLSSPQSSEICSASQKSFSKKIPKSNVKLNLNKFISPKKPYSLRHRKSKQTCDNTSNLDLDLSKLQLDSPSSRKITRSRTAKDAKFAKLLASKMDAVKNDDTNDSTIPTKRETRSSTAKTDQDVVQNTPGYNLRNRKSIIAPSKLKI